MAGRQAVVCNMCGGTQAQEVQEQAESGYITIKTSPCPRCDGWGYIAVIVDHLPVFSLLTEADEEDIIPE